MVIIIRADEVQLLATPGGNFSDAIATTGRGAIEVSIIMQQQEPQGHNPRHTHDREEVMLLRQGRVVVQVAEEQIMLDAGDTVIVPAHTAHQIENVGDERAEWLLIAPAGVRFFGANGDEMRPAWARSVATSSID